MSFNTPTGLMFHHFHGGDHPVVQGSIDQSEFEQILQAVDAKHLLSAQEWLERHASKSLCSGDSCITFDDALLCQIEIAKPILDKYNLKAFWFIYTSIFFGGVDRLELYRYYRTTCFVSIDQFYLKFFEKCTELHGKKFKDAMSKFRPNEYLTNSPFYTDEDKIFRFTRDHFLSVEKYDAIMLGMMQDSNFEREAIADRLWLKKKHLVQLHNEGHIIGCHSDNHPTVMAKLSYAEQVKEYSQNAKRIKSLIGFYPTTASHPCNSYNDVTLGILSQLGIKLGFRADTASLEVRTSLEYPREDHANILEMLRGKNAN